MPQPAPKRGQREVFPRLVELMEDRRAAGLYKYGTPLEAFNGRDPLWDLWAELVDGAQYLVQRKMQDEEIKRQLLLAMDAAAGHKWSKTANIVGYCLELLDGKWPDAQLVNPQDVSPP